MAWSYKKILYEILVEWMHYFITINNSNEELSPLGKTADDSSLNLSRIATLPPGPVIDACSTWDTGKGNKQGMPMLQ